MLQTQIETAAQDFSTDIASGHSKLLKLPSGGFAGGTPLAPRPSADTPGLIPILLRLQDLDEKHYEHSGPTLASSNVVSRFFFWPATRVLSLGRANKHDGLWRLPSEYKSHVIWERFKPYWKEELKKEKPDLSRAVRKTLFWDYFMYLLLQTFYSLFAFVTPILTPYLFTYFEDSTVPHWHGYLYAIAVFLSTFFSTSFNFWSQFIGGNIGIKIRSILSLLVFKKAVRFAPSKEITTGQIVNLIATDAQLLVDTYIFFLTGFAAPIQLAGAFVLMWVQAGLSYFTLVVYIIMFLTLPLNVIMAKRMSGYRRKQQQQGDGRMKLLKELIGAIKLVKFYAWERPFAQRIDAYRQKEIDILRSMFMSRSVLVVGLTSIPVVGIALTFILFSIWNELTYTVVFTAMGLFNLLRNPFITLPIMISNYSMYNVTYSRVTKFALAPSLPPKPASKRKVTAQNGSIENEENGTKKKKKSKKAEEVILDFRGASFNASINPDAPTILKDISFSVKKGEVLMIIGSVGSSKSSLLNAILGEIPLVSGQFDVNGSASYVAQESWIKNGMVRDNICFGEAFEAAKYDTVMKATALEPDLELMPAGDLTEIGDRGVNLSGGQKQRVSLARALYAERDLYLLDAPFEALDGATGKYVFQHAIVGYLKKNEKTAIVVTNQLHFLPGADRILLMDHGQIAECGTFEELMANGKGFKKLIDQFGVFEEHKEAKEAQAAHLAPEKSSDPKTPADPAKPTEKAKTKKNKEETSGKTKEKVETVKAEKEGPERRAESKESESERKKRGNLTGAEMRATGGVSMKVYGFYISSGKAILFILNALLKLAGTGCRIYYAIVLANWAKEVGLTPEENNLWILQYCMFILGEIFSNSAATLTTVQLGVNASRNLHRVLLQSITRATSNFVESTPSGRIISRFSKDMSTIDTQLSNRIDSVTMNSALLLGVIAQMAVGSVWVLIAVPFAVVGYFFILRYYRQASIELQRLESISRAPLFSHLSETLDGAATIRALDKEKAFKISNMNKIDFNAVDIFALRYCTMWFSCALDYVGEFLVLVCYLAMILVRNYSSIDPGLAGVTMSATSGLLICTSAVSMNLADLELRMNAVERVLEYRDIEQEPPEIIEGHRPPQGWPSTGKVDIKDLSISYNKRELALDHVKAVFRPNQKIGLCGRTGSGKSTLLSAIFRMMEPVDGTIVIDDVDMLSIGVHDLRKKLAIVPQIPAMFQGSIRYNLDPFGEASDEKLWQALKHVQMKDFVMNLKGQLDAPVAEGGGNLSVGERQLIAMARALLREGHIIVLDEATSAVSSKEDLIIQKVVRQEFKDKTVIIVAHRLNSIIDADKVLVLDKGHLKEFDSPRSLLKNPKGFFRALVDATGPASAAYLEKIANGELSVFDAIDTTQNANGEEKTAKKKGKEKEGLRLIEKQ